MSTSQVGVRALQQHASRYLDLVEAGHTIEVTRHGRKIARITPVADPADPLGELYRTGALATPAEGGDLLGIVAIPRVTGAPVGDDIFAGDREERL